MTKQRVFLLLYLAIVLLSLLWTAISYVHEPNHQLRTEILLRHGLLMLAISLPSGWLLTAVVGMVLGGLEFEATGLGDAVLVSLTCGVGGYLQWFLFVPWIWRRWRLRPTN